MRSGYFKETIAEQINLTDSAVVRIWFAMLALVLMITFEPTTVPGFTTAPAATTDPGPICTSPAKTARG